MTLAMAVSVLLPSGQDEVLTLGALAPGVVGVLAVHGVPAWEIGPHIGIVLVVCPAGVAVVVAAEKHVGFERPAAGGDAFL